MRRVDGARDWAVMADGCNLAETTEVVVLWGKCTEMSRMCAWESKGKQCVCGRTPVRKRIRPFI